MALLAEKLREKPSAHWLTALEAAGIPAGPVMHYDEVFTDPHILARDMVARTEHPVTGTFHTLGVTVKLSDTPGVRSVAGPSSWRAHRRGPWPAARRGGVTQFWTFGTVSRGRQSQRLLGPAVALVKCPRLGGGHWAAKQEPLHFRTALVQQQIELTIGLHALGGDLQP